MSDDIRSEYRIISDPSWQIQKIYPGKGWVTIAFCGSEESANRSLEKNIAKAIAWSKLTEEERVESVLRLPTTIQGVAYAEAEIDADGGYPVLPESLRNPLAILNRPQRRWVACKFCHGFGYWKDEDMTYQCDECGSEGGSYSS